MKIYVARQPIFDAAGKLFGYEFLYRDSEKNEFNKEMDGSMATCLLISNMISEFGLENLTGGAYAFLNLTEDLLRSDYVKMLDPKCFVVEILEDVRESPVLEADLASLRKQGYIFALDDFTGVNAKERLVEASDIIKVDFRLTCRWEQKDIARRFGDSKILLAEKVETQEEQNWALKNGYSLMQGYYFSRPVLLSKDKTEIALATYMRLLKEFSSPDPDFDRLADIILMDVNLSYKFLLRVNTLQYGGKYRVDSIKQCLVRMGLEEVRRWALAILLRDVFGKKENEAAKRALIRGVFLEKLVGLMRLEYLAEEAYMVGMFSTIDISVRDNLEGLLERIKISRESREALFGRNGTLGQCLDFMENYENGRWENADAFLEKFRLKRERITLMYFEAVKYAETMFEEQNDSLNSNFAAGLTGNSPFSDLLIRQRKKLDK